MGKTLLVNGGPGTTVSGFEFSFFGSGGNGTEAVSQVVALADMTLTNLRANASSGGSGTNNLRVRRSGANGALFATRAGPGLLEDLVNADSFTAAQNLCVAATDDGTDPFYDWCSVNMELASGHGCLHVYAANSAAVHDVASATRFLPLGGRMATDGQASIANAQWKLGADYTLEAWQARAHTNARVNDSTIRVNVNGSQVGTALTWAAAESGTKTASAQAIALAKGDLAGYDITLGAGVEDIALAFVGSLLTSTEGKSECFSCTGGAGVPRTASATPTFLRIAGQGNDAVADDAARIRPGFEAQLEYLRLFIESTDYTEDAQLDLLKNGVSIFTLTIPAGVTGWIEDDVVLGTINDTDELSMSITGGGSGTLTRRAYGFTFAPLQGAVAGTTTWNPFDKGISITLSDGNLTATKTTLSTYAWARSTESKSAGKFYFESTVGSIATAVEFAAAGVAVSSANLADYIGKGANDSGYYSDGSVFNGDATTATLDSYVAGDVIGCAIDLDAGKGWYSKNGVFDSGDPTAGTGEHFTFTPGTELFAGFTLRDSPDNITVNFGAAAYEHDIPSGFESWDEQEPEPEPEPDAEVAAAITYGGGHEYEARVRDWWDRIDSLRAENRAKEEAEREHQSRERERLARVVELEEATARRGRKARDAEKARILAEIEADRAEAAAIREAITAARAEIDRIQAEIQAAEIQRALLAHRRRVAVALLMIAAN